MGKVANVPLSLSPVVSASPATKHEGWMLANVTCLFVSPQSEDCSSVNMLNTGLQLHSPGSDTNQQKMSKNAYMQIR